MEGKGVFAEVALGFGPAFKPMSQLHSQCDSHCSDENSEPLRTKNDESSFLPSIDCRQFVAATAGLAATARIEILWQALEVAVFAKQRFVLLTVLFQPCQIALVEYQCLEYELAILPSFAPW